MKLIRFSLIAAFVIYTSVPIKAQDTSLYSSKTFVKGADTLKYRVLMPKGFNPAKKYPVLVFLHGAGERGNDNKAQLTHGGKMFLQDEVRSNFPAVVIFPQCPADSYWSNVEIETENTGRRFNFKKGGQPTPAMKSVIGLVNELRSESFADKSRFYLAGLSMGGMGTFELLSRKPKIFAAAMPICGGGNTESVKKYAKRVKLWIFHGAKDNVVTPDNSDRMVAALKTAGADVKYTLYPDAEHDSWNNAFAEPDFLSWLFSNKKE